MFFEKASVSKNDDFFFFSFFLSQARYFRRKRRAARIVRIDVTFIGNDRPLSVKSQKSCVVADPLERSAFLGINPKTYIYRRS